MPKYIPETKTANDPFVPQESKKIYGSRKADDDKKKSQYKPDANMLFKMNMEIPNTNPRPAPVSLYPLPYVSTMNPYAPTSFSSNIGLGLTPITPLVKRYNITVNNMQGDISKVGELYEDILPTKLIAQNNRFTTLYERVVLYQYIRTIIIKHSDGKVIDGNILYKEDNDNPNKIELESLLSYISIMDINPYHFSHLTNNHYRTMPDNMLMFKSCYPVIYDQDRQRIQCNSDSISLHVRVYLESYYDLLVADRPDLFHIYYSNLWREIAYYEYIREEIIKKKVSPNFVMMYSYYKTENTSLMFDQLNKLKDDKYNYMFQKNLMNPTTNNKLQLTVKDNIDLSNPNSAGVANLINSIITRRPHYGQQNKSCIIALTEAPTYNILDWCSKAYSYQFLTPIRTQTLTGVHNINEWSSILFQLFSSMIVMYKHNILFKDFSLEDNVYIKDMKLEGHDIGYWKYVIDGISYYIPNYGYLLMIDSNYKDIDNNRKIPFRDNKVDFNPINRMKPPGGPILPSAPGAPTLALDINDFKIRSTMYGLPHENIQKRKLGVIRQTIPARGTLFKDDILNTFKNIFRTSTTGILTNSLYTIPTIVKQLLNNFNSSGKESLHKFVLENFKEYLHNRVGTVLESSELASINKSDKNFKKGELVAYEINPTLYIVSIYLGPFPHKSIPRLNCKVFTSKVIADNRLQNLKPEYVNHNQINKISINLEQTYKPNHRIKQDELLETYII